MTTINSQEDFLQALRDNPQWRDAVRSQILGEDLMQLPAKFDAFVEEQKTHNEKLDGFVEKIDAFVEEQKTHNEKIDAFVEEQKTHNEKIDAFVEEQKTRTTTRTSWSAWAA